MKDLSGLMAQAQKMQEEMAKMKSSLDDVVITGSSGGGMVEVSLTGKGEMKKIKLDKSLMIEDEVEILEDLVLAAYNDTKEKVESNMKEQLSKMTSGLNLPPGMDFPF
ncbi:MAG: YbaB/EbfC family nucleoid-associated protein [Alphaproteobacteria bacterium]|nr:YbaB/EbfC family nucleoid-associated protein [Alphaproteobacteria bacterium]